MKNELQMYELSRNTTCPYNDLKPCDVDHCAAIIVIGTSCFCARTYSAFMNINIVDIAKSLESIAEELPNIGMALEETLEARNRERGRL